MNPQKEKGTPKNPEKKHSNHLTLTNEMEIEMKRSSEIRLSGIPPTSIASRALNENLPPTLNSENRI
jgi:hypothetical protein